MNVYRSRFSLQELYGESHGGRLFRKWCKIKSFCIYQLFEDTNYKLKDVD